MIKVIFALLAYILLSVNSNAKGVEAGTDITNIATLEYQIGGVSHSMSSNSVVDRVDQLIDVNLVWQDTAAILVESGETNRVLTYKITNTGNGKDKFTLTNSNDPSSNFNINNPRIFSDSNNNGIYDGGDLLVSEMWLEADGTSLLFLISDIPTATYANGNQSKNILEAISATGGSGATGTIHSGAGIDGVDAIDSFNGGRSHAVGTYEINLVGVKLTKSASTNTSDVFTGTIITYTILVTLEGVGNVETLVVNDTIPAGTSYVAGSLRLDGVSLSDSGDSDVGNFVSNEIAVNLGNASQTATIPYAKTVTFQVRID
jgi:uncharacterized repeat protein (TIGR01451 family)